MKLKLKKIAVILSALAISPVVAFADTAEQSPVTVAAKVSTLGLGVDLSYALTDTVNGRVGLNHFNYNANRVSNNTNYDGSLKLNSVEALADWHPWTGGFRMTGGLIYNDNSFSMTATPVGGNVTVGNTTYTAAQAGTVAANVTFAKIAPYLGIGWGSAPKTNGFSFSSDIGVMFQGRPRSNVTATGSAVTASDLAQANSDLNNSLSNFRMYPVLSIGLGYSF